VGVATNDNALTDAGEHRAPAPLGRDAGEDLLVGTRRSVAEQRRAEPVELDDHIVLEGGKEVSPTLIDHRRRPRRRRSNDAALAAFRARTRVELLDRPAIGVAAHVHGSAMQRAQQIDRRCRQRPRHDITANDDQVDVLAFELGEDGAQRDGIAVDVIHGRDPHAAIMRAIAPDRPPSVALRDERQPALSRLRTDLPPGGSAVTLARLVLALPAFVLGDNGLGRVASRQSLGSSTCKRGLRWHRRPRRRALVGGVRSGRAAG
jgi:hypothetical protein